MMYDLQQNMQRKTINFGTRAAASLEAFFADDSPERAALEDLAGETLSSESDVLRALVTAGARAVRDHQLEAGYAAWDAAWTDEDKAWSAASARAAGKRWRDEP